MYKQGDILMIPIPFTDLTSSKKRPVLVISNTDYNNKTSDIVVSAITSNITTKNYTVLLTNDSMAEGAIKQDSCIRGDKLYTLSQSIVLKKFGSVKDTVICELKDKLEELLNDS